MNQGKASILIVDDLDDNRDLLSRRVTQLGHSVALAVNGREALERMREQPFDLILLDVMMPEMNGVQVLEAMRADAALNLIPVVMVSATSDITTIVQCIELGAADYIFKPFNPVLLRARVNATLEKKRLADQERETLSQLKTEQEKSERLLLSIFPRPIAERLKSGATTTIAENFADVTILFADINGFAGMTAGKPPTEVVGLLGDVFSAFDAIAEKLGVEKIKTVSDSYMVAGGIPEPRADHAEAVAELALIMQQEIVRLSRGLREPMSLRIGIDTGPVVAGVISTKKFAYDLWGATVSRAYHMESFGLPGAIQVTAETYRRLNSKFLLESRGAFYVPGEGEVETYLLQGFRPGRTSS